MIWWRAETKTFASQKNTWRGWEMSLGHLPEQGGVLYTNIGQSAKWNTPEKAVVLQ